MSEIDHRTVVYAPWSPTTDPTDLKVLGKALEELGEAVAAISRCLIQGINEVEPQTKKPNQEWLEDEIADVVANLALVSNHFKLDKEFIAERARVKHARLKEWHNMPVTNEVKN